MTTALASILDMQPSLRARTHPQLALLSVLTQQDTPKPIFPAVKEDEGSYQFLLAKD